MVAASRTSGSCFWSSVPRALLSICKFPRNMPSVSVAACSVPSSAAAGSAPANSCGLNVRSDASIRWIGCGAKEAMVSMTSAAETPARALALTSNRSAVPVAFKVAVASGVPSLRSACLKSASKVMPKGGSIAISPRPRSVPQAVDTSRSTTLQLRQSACAENTSRLICCGSSPRTTVKLSTSTRDNRTRSGGWSDVGNAGGAVEETRVTLSAATCTWSKATTPARSHSGDQVMETSLASTGPLSSRHAKRLART